MWILASWNVRTPLNADRSIETGRLGDDKQVAAERKIGQVVDVLGRYKVDVAALQETKWFGEDGYRVGKCVVLAAGRSVPGPGVVKQRGGGLPLYYPVLQLVLGKKADVDGKPGALGW